MRYDLVHFAEPMQRFAGVDLLRFNVQTLVTWLGKLAEELLSKDKSLDVPTTMFDVLCKLRSLRDKFVQPVSATLRARGIDVTVFDGLYAWFLPHVARWMDCTALRGKQFVQRAFKLDNFKPMTEDVLHSSSAIDVMTFLTQTYYELTSARWEDPTTANAVFELFAEFVLDTARDYAAYAQNVAQGNSTLNAEQRCILTNDLAQVAVGLRDLCKHVARQLCRTAYVELWH